MQPTLPQQVVLDEIFSDLTRNYMVLGVPGAGKTTLISMVVNKFSQMGINDIVALTFSRDLAQDMQDKIESGFVKTAHAYMFEALRNYLRVKNVKSQLVRQPDGSVRYSHVDDSLLKQTAYAHCKSAFGLVDSKVIPPSMVKEFYGLMYDLMNCVNRVRTLALDYEKDVIKIHELLDLKFGLQTVNDSLVILKTLTDRFFLRGTVDFMGMLYIPLIRSEVHHNIHSPEVLIIDEVNDNTKLLESAYQIIARKSKQVIAVGDEKQTIHIWAGANPNGVKDLQGYYQAKMLTYDFTFRVPKAMCRYLQSSGIDTRIKTYEHNKEGAILKASYNEFLAKVANGDMVLCRYNRGTKVKRTLQQISIDLITRRKKVAFHGSTHIEDISEVLRLSEPLPHNATKQKLKDHVSNCIKNAIATEYTDKDLAKNNYRCEQLREKLGTFVLYFDFFAAVQLFTTFDVKKFIPFLEGMYTKTEDAVQLYSIHRCKGLETKSKAWIFHFEVLVADASNTESELSARIEAHNLALVALTRSKDMTIMVECALPEFFPTPTAG